MARLNEILFTDVLHRSDLVKKSDAGDLDQVSGLENLKLALFRRLLTEPGTLIHRPDYGVGIKRWQNAPATLASKRSLASAITDQFQRDSRVESVVGVRVIDNDREPDKFTIVVRVKVIGYGEQTLEFIPFGEVP